MAGRLDAPDLHDAEAVIIGKQFADITPLVRIMQERGQRIIVDLCDDYQLDPLNHSYAGLLKLADVCTVPSMVLADRLRAGSDVPVSIIPDCVEGDALPPAFRRTQGGALRLLWFGQPANLDALDAALPGLDRFHHEVPLSLTVVTQLSAQVGARFPAQREGLPIRCVPWSPETMHEALQDCHLVVVPSFPTEEKQAKSANRVASALWAGRLPVAFPLPSYETFAGSAVLAEALADGIAWALAHSSEIPSRIADGQALIRNQFTPSAVAEQWHAILADLPNGCVLN
ncbi:hypothetical protein [Azospirillum sp. SYSU D00513]|uniref:hypothetical protein n=1 Tax=Azospirillum sp. SYSU D00513 TaxID=2812561 RepID=UPI001A95F360|nr:hypothetical protein [Azospirillum sp. SYSU D00513]